MVRKWYFELENKFKNITVDEYVIMPDHFHCIIFINERVNLIPGEVGIDAQANNAGTDT